MKQTVYLNDFINAFQQIRPDNFSYEGLEQLFDYLESYEEDGQEQIELDVIALCCDYSELTYQEIIEAHDIDIEDIEPEDMEDHVFNYLANETSVIGRTDTTIIYQQF